MIASEIKIGRLQPEKLQNMLETIQKIKKSRAIIFDFPFSFRYISISSQVFAVEQFRIRHWKANGQTNLMIVSEIKINHLQLEKLRNMFEQIQKMKKNQAIIFDFPFSFR